MKLLMSRKVLFPLGALVLAASVVMGREKPSAVVEPSERSVERKIDAALDLDLSRLDRATRAVPAPEGDPFAARSFDAPPPQQAQAPQPPPEPQAPPLPFRFVGRMIDEGSTVVFLVQGEESLSVRAGQKLGDYRVERITENEVVFVYLPLKKTQTLPL